MPSLDTIRFKHREFNVKEAEILKKINGFDNDQDNMVNFTQFKNYMNLESYSIKRANKYMNLYNPRQPLQIKKLILRDHLKEEKKQKFDKQELYFNQAWEILFSYQQINDNENYCKQINFNDYTLNYLNLIDFFTIFKYLKKYTNKKIKNDNEHDVLVFDYSKGI